MTVIILSSTTSSPDESLASNLQCEMVLLNSARATSSAGDSDEMSPFTKKLWRDESAVEVIGPVESGDLRMAKKGVRM